ASHHVTVWLTVVHQQQRPLRVKTAESAGYCFLPETPRALRRMKIAPVQRRIDGPRVTPPVNLTEMVQPYRVPGEEFVTLRELRLFGEGIQRQPHRRAPPTDRAPRRQQPRQQRHAFRLARAGPRRGC